VVAAEAEAVTEPVMPGTAAAAAAAETDPTSSSSQLL